MFRRILVPLDGSARSEGAIPLAGRLARYTSGTILLLHVVTHLLDAVASFPHLPEETEKDLPRSRAISRLFLGSKNRGVAGLHQKGKNATFPVSINYR